MLTRIWSLSVKEFIHLRNDWWLPAFMLIGGAIELLLVGWATSRPITNLPLVVLDHNRSQASRALVIALENTGTFSLQEQVEDMDAIERDMDRSKIYAALIIPPDYSQQMASSLGRPTLQVLLNGAESTPATAAYRAIEGVVREIDQRILLQRLGLTEKDFAGFDPSLRVWFNEQLSEKLYTTPAEMALMLEFTVLLFAALSFSRERELGTLEQLLVMPLSSLEIILGKAIPVILVSFVDFLLMLGLVHFAFDVPIRGSLALLLILAFGYLLVELGKGMVVSVISRTQHQAFLLVMLVGMTDFMFTGYAAPVESMPPFLQQVANLIPAHHWLAIVRGIMLKGIGLDVLWPHLLALMLLGTVIITFSWRFVRQALN
ncbi:MAG: ABC transporter permease [Anaerolineales bacterium]|nr:ABC transporter permease [Anaerolineales bacterium]